MGAGMDVARLNLSHGSLDAALELYERIRGVARSEGRELGILADLPGPKIRVAPLPRGGAMLEQDAEVILRPGNTASDGRVLEVDYERLLDDVQVGDLVGLADGQILIAIRSAGEAELRGQVLHGGLLRGRPGFYIPADRLSLATPTERDLHYAEAFVEAGVDFLGVSFVRGPDDLRALGTAPPPAGPLLVAKIETRPAVENIDAIINAADAIMVARGDLGIEFPIEYLPHLQKDIIRRCIAGGRPAITATQMLESMIESPVPTRAEASDVANAVFDGSSAVMLSAETAIGVDPVQVVTTMARVAQEADLRFDHTGWAEHITQLHMINPDQRSRSVTDAMTTAASRVVEEVDLAALICVSGSGFTVRFHGPVPPPHPGARLQRRSPDGAPADTELGRGAHLPGQRDRLRDAGGRRGAGRRRTRPHPRRRSRRRAGRHQPGDAQHRRAAAAAGARRSGRTPSRPPAGAIMRSAAG